MMPRPHATAPSNARAWLLYAAPLFAALGVRVLAWWTLPYSGQISDEAEYQAAATWLAQGRGFSFYKEWIWTRPPVYLLFLAGHISLFGPENVWPIRASQALISTASVGLAMLLGAHLATPGHARRVALWTGWLMAMSYGLAIYAFLLLSETLFVALLLAGFLLLTLWAQTPRTATNWPRRYAFLVVGGVLLGLGALTRSLLAGAMPLVALWVVGVGYWMLGANNQAADGRRERWSSSTLERSNARTLQRSLVAAIVFTLSVSVTILSWSVYNSRFFGDGFILIDTTGGYNAMLGVTGGRDEMVVSRALSEIDGQAARQSFAYGYALDWVREHPAQFARKTIAELVDLLQLNYGGAERLRSNYTQGAVPISHSLGLLLDDTLYVIVVPLAVLGLWRRQGRVGKGLLIAWLLYNLLTGPLFFAINRFRVPLLPVLFIFAACALSQWREPWPTRPRAALAWGTTALLLALIAPSYGYWRPMNNGQDLSTLYNTFIAIRSRVIAWDCQRADAALASGDLEAAQRWVDRGSERRVEANKPNGLDCFALLQARIDARRGEDTAALALLQVMKRTPERFLVEGEIYRNRGDVVCADGETACARNPFAARELERANPTRWAWYNLRPPPTTVIDLGNGVDWGYLDGFYGREYTDPAHPFETGYRWTSGDARLRFVGAGTGAPQTLQMRLASPRPEFEGDAVLSVRLAGSSSVPSIISVNPEWKTIPVELPPTPQGEDVVVELASTVFLNGPRELAQRQQVSQQLRLLGACVDWATLGAPPKPDPRAAASATCQLAAVESS
jgi:4-amino-4-deoxy-L-arabinose transferase-like glycosyltransferase